MSAARRLWSRDAPAEAAVPAVWLARRGGAGRGELQCREEGCRGHGQWPSERAGSWRWEGPLGGRRPAAQEDQEAGAVLGLPGNVFLQKNTV